MFGIPNEILIDILMIGEGIGFGIGIYYFFKWLFSIKLGGVRLVINPDIIKKRNENRLINQEFAYDKETDKVPTTQKKLVCIMFTEDKGAFFIIRSMNSKQDYFKFNHGMYIIDNESIHITQNGSRIAFYLEGVSTPIKMSNIQKEFVKVKYTDLYGNEKSSEIQKIVGLKFDSHILDTFANRMFAEIFTKRPIDGFGIIMLILGIVTVIEVSIGCVLTYIYR
jgi:hypothetical protein